MSALVLSAEQKQTVSQQTIQLVEILQMSAQELDAYLGELVLNNPLIDPDASYRSDDEPLHIHIAEEERWEDRDHHGQPPESPPELQIPQAAMSLSQRLFLQLLPCIRTLRDEHILRFLINSLDGRGFLTDGEEQLCRELALTDSELERYIRILQRLEPTGLGARSAKRWRSAPLP